jgi:hypothetical protein
MGMRLDKQGDLFVWAADTPKKTLVPGTNYYAEDDGKTHINVYSKGATPLGRNLSNFADTPFNCRDGNFQSVEGYYYWLGTDHPNRDELRGVAGWEAKSIGRLFVALSPRRVDDFKERIQEAILSKLWAHPHILEELQECKLPLTHYYNFAGIIKLADQHNWVIEFLETFKFA